MTSDTAVACRNVLPYLFVFLLTTCIAQRKPKKNEIPFATVDKNGCKCIWTPWMNNDNFNARIGDDTTYENLRHLYNFCQKPKDIKCRNKHLRRVPFKNLPSKNTVCDVETGLKCTSKPRSKFNHRRENHYYCHDFEISVQCCTCLASTALPETTVALSTLTTMSTTAEAPGFLVVFPRDALPDSNEQHFGIPKSRNTDVHEKVTPDNDIPLILIVILVSGLILILIFAGVIFLVLTKTDVRKRRVPAHSYYEEAPKEDFTSISELPDAPKTRILLSPPSETSDYRTTSSGDEGYRSRPSYNRKRHTKSERDRKLLNNGNRHCGRATDSLEYPTLDSKSGEEETSDDGRFRKWFPDEYERALEQKQRRRQSSKTKLLFGAPLSGMRKKSITYADSEP